MKGLYFGTLAVFSLCANAFSIPALDIAKVETADTKPTLQHLGTSSAGLEKRKEGGIFICTDEYFKGTCGKKNQPLDMCIHLDDPWKYTISSFRPDQGIVCSWYSDYNCRNLLESGIRYPGIADMDTENGCKRGSKRGVSLERRCYGNQLGSFLCKAG